MRKKEITKEAAMLRMADLCAKSEQCSHDIREKLFRTGLPGGAIDEVMNYLVEERFIDDSRYAKAYASDKARFAGWGPVKIQQYLSLKRIPRDYIAEAIDNIPEDTFMEATVRAASAKARGLDLADFKDRQKLLRHLLSKGFRMEMAKRAIASIVSND